MSNIETEDEASQLRETGYIVVPDSNVKIHGLMEATRDIFIDRMAGNASMFELRGRYWVSRRPLDEPLRSCLENGFMQYC